MVACTSPLGFPSKLPGEIRAAKDAPLQMVACGRCMACRLNHARNWSTRIVHEASLHEENSFLTLSYNDENLPLDRSLDPEHTRLWLMRLRKALYPLRIRFFLCGEYGTNTQRPHYHAIIFGTAFRADRTLWSQIRGNLYYRSKFLEETWPYGYSLISDVTAQSAGYVARYSVKKANDFTASGGDPYLRINPETGEVWTVRPEFLRMSRRPGIGFDWLSQYEADCYPSNFVIVDGKQVPIPPAYRKRIREHGSDAINLKREEADQARYELAISQADDNTPERLAVKDEALRLRTAILKREFE